MPVPAYSWPPVIAVHALAAAVAAVLGARLLRAHRANMIGFYAGGLLVTGFFTLLPGRLIGSVVWSWLTSP